MADPTGFVVNRASNMLGSSEAIFSSDRRYRYLYASASNFGSDPCVVFIMLNPSTATAGVTDPTMTRCTNYARKWGLQQHPGR